MNLKKYIRLKEEPKRTPKEEELYNSLVAQVESNAANNAAAVRRFNPWQVIAPTIAVICVIAVVLICVFTLRTPDDFVYNIENVESQQSSFTEMQNDIKYFDLKTIEPTAEQVRLTFYKENNDKLYYGCRAYDATSSLHVIVVVNEKYDYDFKLDDNADSVQLADYTLNYSSTSSRGKPQNNYKGWIKVETETVYFEYVQIPALGDEAFFESIQQIIQLKK